MASSSIQFRTEDIEKIEATQICEKLGLSLQAYLRMCISRLIQEKGIPFSMHIESGNSSVRDALDRASRIAEQYGVADMSLEEINAEIAETRLDR